MRKVKTSDFCFEYVSIPTQGPFTEANQEKIDQIEREKVEPFWGYYQTYTPERLLLMFMNDENERRKWDLIPAEQYHNLLKRYMEDPISARIPDNIVTDWVMLICKNLAQVISTEKLYARTSVFPYDDVRKVFGFVPEPEEIKSTMCMLSATGFYNWSLSPKKKPAWNDWGFPKVYEILKEYREDMDPGDKLILVNRCLDVLHGRGYMAEYFLEGGNTTSDKISKR